MAVLEDAVPGQKGAAGRSDRVPAGPGLRPPTPGPSRQSARQTKESKVLVGPGQTHSDLQGRENCTLSHSQQRFVPDVNGGVRVTPRPPTKHSYTEPDRRSLARKGLVCPDHLFQKPRGSQRCGYKLLGGFLFVSS